MNRLIWTLLAILSFINCNSQELLPFKQGLIWGYRDIKGAVKIEPQFQYATDFSGNIAVVVKNGWAGAIDKNNHVVISFRYQYLRILDSAELFFGYRGKHFGEHIIGVITKKERVIIPPVYNDISKENGRYIVRKDHDSIITSGDAHLIIDTYGLFDSKGKELVPCKYPGLKWTNNHLLIVDSVYSLNGGRTFDRRYALLNKNGEKLTEFEYTDIEEFRDGIAKVKVGNKFGFVYSTGKVAVPIQFDYCEEFINGFAIIKQQGKWGAIDRKGKIIIEPRFSRDEVKTTLKGNYVR